MKPSRFDFIPYDKNHTALQNEAKDMCIQLECFIDSYPDGRAKSIALTKLEETYMWIGKMIRDDQINQAKH